MKGRELWESTNRRKPWADRALSGFSFLGCVHETLFFYGKTIDYLKLDDFIYDSIWDDKAGYDTIQEENTLYPSQKPEKINLVYLRRTI